MADEVEAEVLLRRAADAAAEGDTRAAVMLLFHAAGTFDTLAAAATEPSTAAGATC
jgi:hypothetical protein